MIHRNLRSLNAGIVFFLTWSRVIFISANVVFISLFMLMGYFELKNTTALWTEIFLGRLQQAEGIVDDSGASASIPVVHTLIIDADGTIRKAPERILPGMRLNASGFFGKIHDMQPGQIAVIFFPDMVDGIQRVHFVKRRATDFIVNSYEPRMFFPITLAGKLKLSVVTGDVIWFSDDPSQIGNASVDLPIYLESGHVFTSITALVPGMPGGRLVITQDITDGIRILLLTAFLMTLLFGGISLRIRKVQKDFADLQDDQKGIAYLIQSLSAVVLQPEENVSARLDRLPLLLHQAFRDAGGKASLFEENVQYRSLVEKFIDDILALVEVIKKDALKLRESEERFGSLVSNMPGAVYRCRNDPEWTMSFISEMIQAISGYGAADFIDNGVRSFASIIHPDDRDLVDRAVQDGVGNKRSYSIEYRLCRQDGGTRWVHERGQGIFDSDGSLLRLEGVILDATERRRAEEDRVARELAERASRAKSEFISRMSHELRTPLNAILGFGQLLKMDELRPDQERGIDYINKSGRHLLDLVNEVLDIAKMESGKMRLAAEAIRLEAPVKEALELIRPLAEGRHISLSFNSTSNDDLLVLADRQRLRQVLLNLLSNAVKYNREGGEIAVTGRVAPNGRLRLLVRDSGEGIAPDKMERLFVPFDRLDRDAVEQDGTGLGLALSKGLMEAMGGTIGAESVPGVGSTFWLELKLAEA